MLATMKIVKLLPLILFAACSSGPTEQESVQIFGVTTAAMATAQGRAVVDTSNGNTNVSFTGPCTLGGSVSVTGSYQGADTGDRAAFDLNTTFDNCKELTGTIDGSLQWTSVADGTNFTASMTGSIDFDGSNASGSCDFDLHMAVTSSSVNYSGSMCGYDVQADLGIRTGS
jgi:hypothetical protein